MLPESEQRILDRLGEGDKVLDVGGWADPFPRADWVLDMMPFETRGLYERRGWVKREDKAPERFSAETWVQRDICDHEPFPFEDDEFDYVVCAQTLEDIRDPIWVCREMARVAKAGYVEVPSLLEELSYGFRGPLVGREHHRWLVQMDQGACRIEFSFKDHSLHHRWDSRFPAGFYQKLSETERAQALWWEGTFEATERHYVEISASDEHLAAFVRAELDRRGLEPPKRPGWRERLKAPLRRVWPMCRFES